MTDLDALREAALASPDDHAAKLVWLDAFQEQHGETPWVVATREFLAKCGERRKYKTEIVWSKSHFDGSDVCDEERRRALPGWREWLGDGDSWQQFTEHLKTWVKATPFATGWMKLVPSILSVTTSADMWRRKGATVEVETTRGHRERAGTPYTYVARVTFRARLTFAHGFLARAEFATWQAADALLPAILADQPFVEAGIAKAISGQNHWINERFCGPAREFIVGWDAAIVVDGTMRSMRFRYRDPARARRALSTALRKRALTPASAPTEVTA